MIAGWMLYALLIAGSMAVAGLVAERLARLLEWPRRWGWMASIAASLLTPVALPVWSGLSTAPSPGVVGPVSAAALAAPIAASSGGVHWAALAEMALEWGWLAASAAGALLLVGSGLSLRRQRRRWKLARVDGIPVLISRRTGPAVVGLLDCTIVLPEWVLEAPAEQRRLIVAHEREHMRVRDPLLVGAALAALVLVPWNLALWWQVRRFQLAIEVDCDRRVLNAERNVGEYAALLLEVGRRASRVWLPVPAFSEPVSLLERRIRDMTARRPRHVTVRAALLAMLLLVFPLALGAAPVVSHPTLTRVGGWLAGGATAEPRPVPDITLPTTTTFGRGGARIVLMSQAPQPGGRTPASDPRPARRPAAPEPAPASRVVRVLQDTAGTTFELRQLERMPSLANKDEIAGIMNRLYPPLIRQAGIGGKVESQFVIEADGTVRLETVRVLRSPNEQLSASTVQAITRFRFDPGLYQGKPVRVLIQMPVSWVPETVPAGPPSGDGVVPVR